MRSSSGFCVVVLAVFLAALLPGTALGQADEIQVYDGGLSAPGVFNLVLHNNFTPVGVKAAAFPGGIIPDRSFNGVAEWAYGVTNWFEVGLYLPLYSVARERGPAINGGKIRLLFAVPDADGRKFFYGVNFEFSCNSKHWDLRRYTSEIRPIIGWHLKAVDLIVNPIMDTDYTGGFKGLEFVPAARAAYNLSPKWAVAVEEYADVGTFRQFSSVHQQSHQVFGVVNHKGKALEIEAGIGFGVTAGSDRVTMKLMFSRDLNHPKRRSGGAGQ